MNPIPTKHSKELLKIPSSLLPTGQTARKPPRERFISNDQMDTFRERYTITNVPDLNETAAAEGFQFIKSNDYALFYNLVFDEQTKFPKILKSIKHPGNFDRKTYVFYDTVHIKKNIRNKLFNGKNFLFIPNILTMMV